MGSRSATELLQLPVQLNGIRLGRPVDLLLDSEEWRALGFVVLCGDQSLRFLVFAAADVEAGAIRVSSALMLLEDVEFYRARSRSLRELLKPGEVRDLVLAPDGVVDALLLPDGSSVEVDQVSPARG
jgi:hypothetical protein